MQKYITFAFHILKYKTYSIMSEVAAKVTAIIIDKLGLSEGQITPEANFTTDLGADSLDIVELIMAFEKAFEISIPDEDSEHINTVGQAVDYLQKRLHSKTV